MHVSMYFDHISALPIFPPLPGYSPWLYSQLYLLSPVSAASIAHNSKASHKAQTKHHGFVELISSAEIEIIWKFFINGNQNFENEDEVIFHLSVWQEIRM